MRPSAPRVAAGAAATPAVGVSRASTSSTSATGATNPPTTTSFARSESARYPPATSQAVNEIASAVLVIGCAPCPAIAPLVEQLSETYSGQVKFGKFDIDANPKVPTQYEIRSIPTLLLFKGGQVVGQIVGAVPKAKIEDLIKRAL